MRIGFVFADMSTGSAAAMLPSLASSFPDNSKDSIILFPGGRLKENRPIDARKNTIYNLVSPKNLDSSVMWCSSLSGLVNSEEVLDYFNDMTKLPMVTIDGKSHKYSHICDVKFDAYDGSKQIVEHFIKVHGLKKIAYIRGPLNHNSGEERYRAYLETLKNEGLEIDENLISEPKSWFNGADSMKQ
ncbi:MAG: hypothetical protein HUK24_08125, partial [Sphaerochaetaceae bacterium]|nr:hypothetical protein [Sphaerochaetaceae bacterium]